MSKIWFFGDSYAAKKTYAVAQNSPKSWTVNVQEAFPEHDNENLALSASSLDYLYYTYEKKKKRVYSRRYRYHDFDEYSKDIPERE